MSAASPQCPRSKCLGRRSFQKKGEVPCTLQVRAFGSCHLSLSPSASAWLRANWFWRFVGQILPPLSCNGDTDPILQPDTCRWIKSLPPVPRSHKFPAFTFRGVPTSKTGKYRLTASPFSTIGVLGSCTIMLSEKIHSCPWMLQSLPASSSSSFTCSCTSFTSAHLLQARRKPPTSQPQQEALCTV